MSERSYQELHLAPTQKWVSPRNECSYLIYGQWEGHGREQTESPATGGRDAVVVAIDGRRPRHADDEVQQADDDGGETGNDACNLWLLEEWRHQKRQIYDRHSIEEHQQEEHKQTLLVEKWCYHSNKDNNKGHNEDNQHVD